MKLIFICIFALNCSVLALADNRPGGQSTSGDGFRGQKRGFSSESFSHSRSQQQPRSLPYGANTPFEGQSRSGARFARSPQLNQDFGNQGSFGGIGGFGGSSYSQPQQQSRGLPYGANTPFEGQSRSSARFARSPQLNQDFGSQGSFGGIGGSSYSQPQQQPRSLPYGANTPFEGQSRSGARFARSPQLNQDFGNQGSFGGIGGFGGSSYSQPQQQPRGLPYGANTPFEGQSRSGARFARSPQLNQDFGNQGSFGGIGGFGGSSYSQPQQQPRGLPYGANTPFEGQSRSGARFARSPQLNQDFGNQGSFGGIGGFGGSSYSQPQQQPRGLPYGANTPFEGQSRSGARFARSPQLNQDFGNQGSFGGIGGFGGSSYSQQQQQPRGLPYGANTPFEGQSRSGARFARSPQVNQDFGSQGSFGGIRGFGGSSYSQSQQQPRGLPYGANTPFGEAGFESGNNGFRGFKI